MLAKTKSLPLYWSDNAGVRVQSLLCQQVLFRLVGIETDRSAIGLMCATKLLQCYYDPMQSIFHDK